MAVVEDLDMFEDERGRGSGGPLGKIFGVAFDPHTYGAILYMLLALPLGIGYFTFVTVGLSLSLGLLILIIGILVALLFLTLTRGISIVEGFITGVLLGANIPHHDDGDDIAGEGDDLDDESAGGGGGIWSGIKRMLADARTWTSMIYMALMLPLGIAYFTIAVTGFVTAIATMFAPVASVFTDHVHVMTVDVDEPEFLITLSEFANSPAGLVVMSVFGFVLLIFMLHLSRGIGWMHARFAERMLVKRS